MNTRPPTDCPAWRALAERAPGWRGGALKAALAADPARARTLVADAPGLRFDYSRQRLDAAVIAQLVELAVARDLPAWRMALLAGETVNDTEQRPAWHSALRAGAAAPAEVHAAHARMRSLAARLREGTWHGAGGRPIERIVHLGTGGSDLGPRLVVDALAESATPRLRIDFAANVDPLDLERALRDANPQTTLFVIVSKTFTTQETMENARAAKAWLAAGLPPGAALEPHFVAVSANVDAARGFGAGEVLPMWDWVGGRYSVWSAVGFTAMAAIGETAFAEFLAGAGEMDAHFAGAPLARNVPVLMALVGVWNVNFLDAATQAVLPYATPLRLLPAYLQQLEMESNGKRVDRAGRTIGYATAPVVWGAEGTVGQHSFHQLLHQGTQTVPADFIVFDEAPGDPARRAILAAHAEAQAEALAQGLDDPALPAYRRYPGSRPSSTLRFERLDARNLGRLIALYEHKVFTQGVIWNINSFDQWGVELGKQLAKALLEKARRPSHNPGARGKRP
jgi:glucose-6-phosphate isomerase